MFTAVSKGLKRVLAAVSPKAVILRELCLHTVKQSRLDASVWFLARR